MTSERPRPGDLAALRELMDQAARRVDERERQAAQPDPWRDLRASIDRAVADHLLAPLAGLLHRINRRVRR